jgi:hypothetical protein
MINRVACIFELDVNNMAFKEDWSFLDKITMGAVGTEKVIEELNKQGHHIIELERHCTSNCAVSRPFTVEPFAL